MGSDKQRLEALETLVQETLAVLIGQAIAVAFMAFWVPAPCILFGVGATFAVVTSLHVSVYIKARHQ